MNRFRTLSSIVVCVWGCLAAQAQEAPGAVPTIPEMAEFVPPAAFGALRPADFAPEIGRNWLFPGAPFRVKLPIEELRWMREGIDPVRHERRMRMQQRAQQSIRFGNGPKKRRDFQVEVRMWNLDVGNSGIDNWSVYPDRMLDARMLRFPLPRNLHPDKRPEPVRRMGSMKR